MPVFLQRIPQVKAIHPKAKGTQDQEVRSGVGEQMENIARQFLERVWPSLHADSKDKPVAKLKALTGYDGELDLYLLLPRNPHSQFLKKQTYLQRIPAISLGKN